MKARGFGRVLPYVLIFPAFSVYLAFTLIPLVQNFAFSLFKWQSFVDRSFYGFHNYLMLAHDEVFWAALSHNLIWAGLTLAFPLLVGLVLASLLFQSRFRVLFSSLYFIPCTVPLVVSAIMWGWIYNPAFGLLNFILEKMGLSVLKRNWLADPRLALYMLNILGAWTFFGFCTVIVLSALQNVDKSVYEAAKIDGASNTQCFFHITLPLLKDTVVFLSVYSIIGAMKFFDIVYISTQGGPGHSTEILGTYVFKLAFRQQRIGYASSVAMVLFLIVFALSLFLVRRSQYEES